MEKLSEAIPGSKPRMDGYEREPSNPVEGVVLLEFDPAQVWEVVRRGRGHRDIERQIGIWRLWVGPILITYKEFRVTQRHLPRNPKRADEQEEGESAYGEEVDVKNPCPNGTRDSSTDPSASESASLASIFTR